MILKLQIYSLIFSFVFGIVFFFVLELFRDFIYNKKIVFRIINALIYFGILRKINYGIIHYYFFLMILLGYCISKYIYVKIFVKRK